jgi:UDP-N-acetylmuramyl pentapeptide phosphotransferase/UDP-N-acetylglucosamine-1-phosphate transferase
MHVDPTPTAGGLAVLAAVCAAVLAYMAGNPGAAGASATLGALALMGGLGLLGALDDAIDIGPRVKLAAQALGGLLFALLVARTDLLPLAPGVALHLPLIVGVLGTALWLVVVVNAYNFMDGADGLAVGVQSIALFTLALGSAGRPLLAFTLLAASIANLAFLPFNHPGRRLFQGDCGAMGSAALIGAASVLLARGPAPASAMYLAVFVSAPLLTDVLLTLAMRARARESLWRPHKQHLYQRWLAATGHSHGALAWRVWALCAACALFGYVVIERASDWAFAALAAVIVALSAGWVLLGRRLARPTPAG